MNIQTLDVLGREESMVAMSTEDWQKLQRLIVAAEAAAQAIREGYHLCDGCKVFKDLEVVLEALT